MAAEAPLESVKKDHMKTVFALLLSILVVPSFALFAQEERFATSDAAVKALTAAGKAKDTNALAVIFGPVSTRLISADPVQASNGLAHFSRRISEKVTALPKSDSKIELDMGSDAWPFPIPLVKTNNEWFFDTDAGEEEILNRRIGRSELDTIRVCHAYVEAQRQYACMDRMGDGVMQYAQHLRSSPGAHDGLYWHAEPGEEPSPLGPLIAAARGEGYTHESKIMTEAQVPYHGYYFKVLTRQGRHAPGGKFDYVINGHMVAGFALVAWPAEWGNSGVMTFIVNPAGIVYEANLGLKTASIAQKMTAFDPGPGWKPEEQ
jgi:hypothetical protein